MILVSITQEYSTPSSPQPEIFRFVSPLQGSLRLDEALDEMTVVGYNSDENEYPINSLVYVRLINRSDSSDQRIFPMLIAQDIATRYPNAFLTSTPTYRHELLLIEPTKALEGIVCQSLTFTNPRGQIYTDSSYYAFDTVAQYNVLSPSEVEAFHPSISIGGETYTYGTPVVNNGYKIPSARALANAFLPLAQNIFPEATYGKLTVADAFPSIPPGQTLNPSTKIYIDGTLTRTIEENSADYANTVYTIPDGFRNVRILYTFSIQAPRLYPVGETSYMTFIDWEYHIAGVENALPPKKWTLADVCDRILDLAEPLRTGQTPRFSLSPETRDRFEVILAPEFSMSQCTLREQLKVVGGFAHCEPRLTIVQEGGTAKEVITFDELGARAPAKINGMTAFYKLIHTRGIDSYCTDIISNASNLVNSSDDGKGVITDPSSDTVQSIRTEQINVRVSDGGGEAAGEGIAMTSLGIYDIVRVECGILTVDGQHHPTGYYIDPVDITPYVYERVRYETYLSSYAGSRQDKSKAYAIYFSQGSEGLRGLFFRLPSALSTSAFSHYAICNILSAVTGKTAGEIQRYLADPIGDGSSGIPLIAFRISYKPIFSAIVSHGKQLYQPANRRFSRVYNQSGTLLETTYYGENIKGVAARLGNAEETRIYYLDKVGDIPTPGETIDGMAVSSVDIEVTPANIKAQVNLTQDFNRISQYVGINSEKRVYEVSERQSYDRTVMLRAEIVIGQVPKDLPSPAVSIDLQGFADAFRSGGKMRAPVTSANVSFSNKPYSIDSASLGRFAIPVVGVALGNAVTFNYGCIDNYSAGRKVEYNSNDGISGYWQIDAPYADFYGRAKYASASLYSTAFQTAVGREWFALSSPTWDGTSRSDTPAVTIPQMIIRKDSRENIRFAVTVEVKTSDESITIGSGAASMCSFINGDAPRDTILWWVFSTGAMPSKFDRVTYGMTPLWVASDQTITLGEYASGRIPFVPVSVPTIGGSKPAGYVIAKAESEESYDAVDDEGNTVTQTVKSGGEILLTGTIADNQAQILQNTYIFQGG